MKKIEKAEKELYETIGNAEKTYTDKQALKNLSKWVLKYFGNVNVAQRLSIMANDF
jgi:hypothetical protein